MASDGGDATMLAGTPPPPPAPLPPVPLVGEKVVAGVPWRYGDPATAFAFGRQLGAGSRSMVKLAVKPRLMRRLATVVKDELGHDLAFAVERGKISANRGEDGARIVMERVEAGLSAPITRASLDASLARYRDGLRRAAGETKRLWRWGA